MRTENVTVRFDHGLHLRVAARIAEIVQRGKASVQIQKDGRPAANAGSVLELLCLGAKSGSNLTVTADGPEKDIVVNALAELFEQGGGI
ncbi:MAG TPA: HPr family phosphocarrier protein [Verrucomicrobia bacterium]|nr:HPr family phosphocarrier protein [Verrucomicrobiota bacterium]